MKPISGVAGTPEDRGIDFFCFALLLGFCDRGTYGELDAVEVDNTRYP